MAFSVESSFVELDSICILRSRRSDMAAESASRDALASHGHLQSLESNSVCLRLGVGLQEVSAVAASPVALAESPHHQD